METIEDAINALPLTWQPYARAGVLLGMVVALVAAWIRTPGAARKRIDDLEAANAVMRDALGTRFTPRKGAGNDT